MEKVDEVYFKEKQAMKIPQYLTSKMLLIGSQPSANAYSNRRGS